MFIYTVLANAKPLFHMSLRTTKGSHKIILFILQYCSLFSLSVTAYRRATSLVRERLALIVLFTKERLDREVSLMNSIIRQGSPCEGGCGCPVDTFAEGKSTDRADRRDLSPKVTEG